MELLPKERYDLLKEMVNAVAYNNLFARAVIEQKVNGKIYADRIDQPSVVYIVHNYGMSLLLGDSRQESFNQSFRQYALNENGQRSSYEWMQAFPSEWDKVLPALFGSKLIKSSENTAGLERGIVELNTRVNFTFNKKQFLATRITVKDPSITIVPLNSLLFREMKGSVIPAAFWNSEEDFWKEGMAFCLLKDGQLAATAFSSFMFGDQLELGIETLPEYRGQGLAYWVCASLLDYCINNNYNPIWACRLENTGSFKLAQKLGFQPTRYIPYYRLSR